MFFIPATYSRHRACILRRHLLSRIEARISVAGDVDFEQSNVSRQQLQCAANVHTTVCQAKNVMKRLFNKSKKKLWYETPPQSTSGLPDFLKHQRKPAVKDSSRPRILNSILYKAITDLLASSELDSHVLSFSVEVTRVSMSQDFTSCRVYWKASGVAEQDDLIQAALDRTSPRIRYLIMSHQTMGGVPPLVFVKDKQYAALVEIDKLLQAADFGPEDPDRLFDRREQVQMTDVSRTTTPVLFGVDHEAIGRQIRDYKQRRKEAETGEGPVVPHPALTEAQLCALEEYRKQKIKEKKMKKNRRDVDDDITLKEFLLTQHSSGQEAETDEGGAFNQEETQLRELMAEENRKS